MLFFKRIERFILINFGKFNLFSSFVIIRYFSLKIKKPIADAQILDNFKLCRQNGYSGYKECNKT